MEKLVYIIQCPPFWLKTPPLALVYLKNYLENKGIPVGIIDLNTAIFKSLKKTSQEWLKLNRQFEESLFGLTEKYCPQILENLYRKIENTPFVGFSLSKRNAAFSFSLAEKIKSRFPDKGLIFGGPETLTLERENILDGHNYWVIGEGEMPLYKISSGEKNKIYQFEEIDDLDRLPFYDFENIYGKEPGMLSPHIKTIPLFSSRGCPYQCRFCSERLLYKKFRCHSPGYMLEQIKLLKNKYKTSDFVFLDSLINHSQSWLEDFCRGSIKQNLKISWEAQFRIKKGFPLRLAKLMKESGCYNLFIGLESASNKILKLMHKGFTCTEALSCFKTLNNAGLHFEISLIFGYPGEEEKDFQETLKFIRKNKRIIPKIAQANPFYDYLNNFVGDGLPSAEAKKRVEVFLQMINTEKIPYTKSFINNLIY